MKHLGNLPNLYILSLKNTNITDKGLEHLKNLKSLGILSLDNTNVTNEGMRHLIPLQNLMALSLFETQITEASLIYLKELKNIRKIGCFYVKHFSTKELKEMLPHYGKIYPYYRGRSHKWNDLGCGTSIEDRDYSITLTLVTDKTGIVRSGLFRPVWWEHYSYKFFGLKYSW